MLKRIAYIFIAISLFLLIPSFYGIIYSFSSEKMIELVFPIENGIKETIDMFVSGELVCQKNGILAPEGNQITPKKIKELDEKIMYECSTFLQKGFSDPIADYMNFVLKFKIGIVENFLMLRESTRSLRHFIYDTLGKEKELFCYFDDEEEVGIELPPPGGGESEYTPLLRQRLLEKYGQRESLKTRKARAQENLNNHIAKLEEYLNTIRAARLAHEPHRPMIRFIGWSWLIFESVGMVLLLCAAYVEFKAWRKRKGGSEG